jgi:hypothetical protein
MNQLSIDLVGRNGVDLPARRRRNPAAALVCRWRRDASTGALCCFWTVSRGSREPAAPVPLRRASRGVCQ